MNIYIASLHWNTAGIHRRPLKWFVVLLCVLACVSFCADEKVLAQSGVSGVRAFGGGVAPLFSLTGPGSLYIDGQGTQGYLYTPGQNFESYNFRNPTTGQAWSGAVMTFGPQLSIGLIQGANQTLLPGTSATVLPGPPRQSVPLPPIESGIFDEIP